MNMVVKWNQKFSDESLERLAIAICNLTTKDGLAVNVHIEDILQPWVAEQFPPLPDVRSLRNCNL